MQGWRSGGRPPCKAGGLHCSRNQGESGVLWDSLSDKAVFRPLPVSHFNDRFNLRRLRGSYFRVARHRSLITTIATHTSRHVRPESRRNRSGGPVCRVRAGVCWQGCQGDE